MCQPQGKNPCLWCGKSIREPPGRTSGRRQCREEVRAWPRTEISERLGSHLFPALTPPRCPSARELCSREHVGVPCALHWDHLHQAITTVLCPDFWNSPYCSMLPAPALSNLTWLLYFIATSFSRFKTYAFLLLPFE